MSAPTTVAELLASPVSPPRITVYRIRRALLTDPMDVVETWLSTAPYRTEPGDADEFSADPAVLGQSWDWSQVSVSSGKASLSGRSKPNRGEIVVANHRGDYDAWPATSPNYDGRVIAAVTAWHTAPGIPWSEVSESPTHALRAKEPVSGRSRRIVITLEGVEALLDGVKMRGPSDVLLGLGDALRFVAAESGVVSVPHHEALVPATRLDLEVTVYVPGPTAGDQTLVARGPLGTVGASYIIYVNSSGSLRALLKGTSSNVNLDAGTVPTNAWVTARLFVDTEVPTASLWIDGIQKDADALSGFAWDFSVNRGVSFGGDLSVGAGGRHLAGFLAEVRIDIDGPTRAAADVLDQSRRPLTAADGYVPTAYFRANEGLGNVFADDPTFEGTLSGTGASWDVSLTGDPEQHGEPLPIALGVGERFRPVRVSRHGGGWWQLHGGNRRTDEPVHGLGPADIGGAPLLVVWGEDKVGTGVKITTDSLVSGGNADFLGLVAGQRIQLVTASALNDGTHVLTEDSTETTIKLASVLTPEAAGQTVTVRTAGRADASSLIAFSPQETVLTSADMGASGGWAKYLHPAGPAITFEGTAANSSGTPPPSVTAQGVSGDSLSVAGALTPEAPGREVRLVRSITVAAGDLTWSTVTGVSPYQRLILANHGTLYPPFGPFRAVIAGGAEITYEIVISGATGVAGANRTYRVVFELATPNDIRVEPIIAGSGTSSTPVTMTLKEVVTDLIIESRPAAIVSTDESLVLTGLRAGGTVAVTGSAANNVTRTISGTASVPNSTETQLEVEGDLTLEPAGNAVTLTYDDQAVQGIVVYPSLGAVSTPALPALPMSVATRGDADGGFARTGASLFDRVLTKYAKLDPELIRSADLTAWAATDSHDRGLQILDETDVSTVLDQIAQPVATWGGSTRGDTIEVSEFAPPEDRVDLDPTLRLDDATGHFGVENAATLQPARRRPLFGGRNMVVLDEGQVAGIVRDEMPERITAITREWIEADAGRGDRGIDDDPVRTTYADAAGLRYAAEQQLALHGVDRLSFSVTLPPSVLAHEPRTLVIVLTDVTIPALVAGRAMRLLSLTRGDSSIKHPARLLG